MPELQPRIGVVEAEAPLVLYRAVYDERFPEGRAFGREAEALGLTSHGFSGDITAFWYDDLQRRWAAGVAAIAGLTGHGAFFCLERWAWDAGMRVLFRAEHRPFAAGVEHSLTGPASVLSRALAGSIDRDWPREMARLVAEFPYAAAEPAQQWLTSPGVRFGAPDEDLLVSWVIGPARRTPDTAIPHQQT